MYGESKITEALMDNTSIALAYEELYSIFDPLSHMPNPYIWFVSQTCTVIISGIQIGKFPTIILQERI